MIRYSPVGTYLEAVDGRRSAELFNAKRSIENRPVRDNPVIDGLILLIQISVLDERKKSERFDGGL